MFAHDRGWVRRLRETVETGLTAEAAVERVQGENRARMVRTPDAYLRDRMHDLDDLANRLLRILTGQTGTAARGDLPHDAIVVARNMGPAELLDYDRTGCAAWCSRKAGPTSHVAIVARALGMPAVGQVTTSSISSRPASRSSSMAGSARSIVRPSPGIERAYADKVAVLRPAPGQVCRAARSTGGDARRPGIALSINAGLLVDLPHLRESGADGIGLFRTELQFMLSRRVSAARPAGRAL